jgi:GntR family transcriptional regulator/MocR family aminotransferase
MRPVYAQRWQTLERGAQEHWSNFMQVQPGNAGLHLSSRIADPAAAETPIDCARRHLPGALPLSAYAAAPLRQSGLCIGYGGVEVDQIATAVQALGAAMRSSRYCRRSKIRGIIRHLGVVDGPTI